MSLGRGFAVIIREALLTLKVSFIQRCLLFRNLIGDKEAVSLTDLETMVCYIRSQVKHMDTIDSELLLRTGRIKLLPCTLTPIT